VIKYAKANFQSPNSDYKPDVPIINVADWLPLHALFVNDGVISDLKLIILACPDGYCL